MAHQIRPPHLRQLAEDTVKSFDDKWLLPPVEGELFDAGNVTGTRGLFSEPVGYQRER
jgi:hypothetical protein